jgi:hypothetical protein
LERSRAHDVGPTPRTTLGGNLRRRSPDGRPPIWETPSRGPCVRVGPARASQRHQQPPNLFGLLPFPVLYSPCRPLPCPFSLSFLARHATQRIGSSPRKAAALRLRATKGGRGDEDAVEGVLNRGLLPPALLLLRRPHGRPSLSPLHINSSLFVVVGGGFGSGVGDFHHGASPCLGSKGTGRFARQPLASRAIAEMPSCLSVL